MMALFSPFYALTVYISVTPRGRCDAPQCDPQGRSLLHIFCIRHESEVDRHEVEKTVCIITKT